MSKKARGFNLRAGQLFAPLFFANYQKDSVDKTQPSLRQPVPMTRYSIVFKEPCESS